MRQTVESRAAEQPDLRDVFLCHAWDDRQGVAKHLHDLLEAAGVKVWFSEKDLGLGVPMMRAIDKGLLNSRIGLVLVTPAFLDRIPKEGVADKELSVLLARNQLVPIVHNTTYDALRNVSPMLASRSGLDTSEDSMAVVAAKIAELVAL
ncbi:toll/interleukin-1 receptor domain-containing protein [Fluviibacter phosphoraccumulans]|uniref:toll/interleukin-1 receptor domain-containing protein n=1 Tax=Fluviibacter phosphoraccumulans TaxID=1751046 RepID=UPI002342DFB1|nr:toll/interleukin-1 receptor domain-containing protein [Fluviibacter phosphoraccumulans]